MYSMSGGKKWHCGEMRNRSLQVANQSRNLRVVFCTSLLHILRDDAVNGLYSSWCCVLFKIYILFAYSMIKGCLYATGMMQKTAAMIDWVT